MDVNQRKFWEKNGFLVLPQFYSKEEIESVQAEYDRFWMAPSREIVVDDLVTHRRCTIADLSEEERQHPYFKVNDLYLASDTIREVCLSTRVVPILNSLMAEPVVACNTLNMRRGSQQPYHVDSIYMTPVTHEKLLATWIALEDVHPDAGPLSYYPGSHQIPPYRFSSGTSHHVPAEMDAWRSYYDVEIKRRALTPEVFLPKKGDLFIWHAQLLHGGLPVQDVQRTRDSLVTHYYSISDCKTRGLTAVPKNGAYWNQRDPQPIPPPPPRPPVWKQMAKSLIAPRWRERLRNLVSERI